MTPRLLAPLFVAGLAACGSTPTKPGPSGPTSERVRIGNQAPFDVAVCQAPTPGATPLLADKAVIEATLIGLQPWLLECLTPADTRGPALATEVSIALTLDDKGAAWKATGDNLLAPGAACLEKVLAERVPLAPLPAGHAPIAVTHPLSHDANVNPALVANQNIPTDWVGEVRRQLPSWCECYAPFAGKRPPELTADVELANGVAKVIFQPASTPEGIVLSSCLQPHLVAIAPAASPAVTKFPLRLRHFHSLDATEAKDFGPELAFQQAELVRFQRFAGAQKALAERARRAADWDALVAVYQKTKKSSMLKELVSTCDALVAADGQWLGAARSLLEQEQRMEASTNALAAEQDSWKNAAQAISQARAKSDADVKTAAETQDADKKACPKVSYH